MLLACPQCEAKYEVPPEAIPPEGRDVQCSNCGHVWFQASESDMASSEVPAQADASEDDAEYDDAEAALMAALMMDDDDEPASTLPPPPPRKIDDSVLAVLREEADRESEARAREREARRKAALLESPAFAVQEEAPARHKLLPDVEEINSTLQPDPIPSVIAADHARVAKAAPFKMGFVFGLILAVIAGGLYLKSAEIASAVPSLSDPLAQYKALMDQLISQFR